jgi:hypothetical protein
MGEQHLLLNVFTYRGATGFRTPAATLRDRRMIGRCVASRKQ